MNFQYIDCTNCGIRNEYPENQCYNCHINFELNWLDALLLFEGMIK